MAFTFLHSAALVAMSALAGAEVWRRLVRRRLAGRLAITGPDGIDELRAVTLGGVPQWISVRGRDRRKPLLLFIHGGPGFPQMPVAHLHAELESTFVVIHWDQRGAGKSYSPRIPPETMTVSRLTADALELVRHLLAEHRADRLFLLGYSWGSVIGLRLAAANPELFHAYIGFAQVVNPVESARGVYRFALLSAEGQGRRRAARELERIGPPPYADYADYRRMSRWARHFARQRYEPFPLWRIALAALVSPTYSLADFANAVRGVRFSFRTLWREAYFSTDMRREVPRVDVPVYFFQGRHDYLPPAASGLAAEYFGTLDGPEEKRLVWFDHSDHYFPFQERRAVVRALAEIGARAPCAVTDTSRAGAPRPG